MKSPLGNEVRFWQSGCGSFREHGLYGSHDDLFTRAYISATGRDDYPTRIVMSIDVFERYVRAAVSPRVFQPDPRASTMAELERHFIERLSRCAAPAAGMLDVKFHDAEVTFDRQLPSGVALFYFKDALVAETSGWAD